MREEIMRLSRVPNGQSLKGSDSLPDESVLAAIDAARDAGGEHAGSVATSAIAQAARAATSAWHAGPQ